ncbi:MAG: aminopeptidase N, partial [Rhodospirillaceae bacterium]|nr:aminopeptidase N [Rhodospirillaceae bacterium]
MTPSTSAAEPKAVQRADYQVPAHMIESVDLDIDLYDEATVVTSRLNGRRNPESGSGAAPLVLFGVDLELVSLVLNDNALSAGDYTIEGEDLTIPGVGGDFILDVVTRIKPAENSSLEGLYLSGGMSGGMYCTQCEAEGFRKITYFPDRPDVMAIYRTTIRADKAGYPVLLSNGNPIDAGELVDGRHFATWHDPFPKPSYLFAMVAGDLAFVEDSHTTGSG